MQAERNARFAERKAAAQGDKEAPKAEEKAADQSKAA